MLTFEEEVSQDFLTLERMSVPVQASPLLVEGNVADRLNHKQSSSPGLSLGDSSSPEIIRRFQGAQSAENRSHQKSRKDSSSPQKEESSSPSLGDPKFKQDTPMLEQILQAAQESSTTEIDFFASQMDSVSHFSEHTNAL